MSYEIDKNKRVEQKYFNSKDNIVSEDDFNSFQKASKSFNSVFEKNQGKVWNDNIKTEFDLMFKKDLESDLTLPVDALRVEKNINKAEIENKSQKALENFEKKVSSLMPKVNKNSDITKKYTGSVEGLNEYLKDTPLKDLGQHFINVQEKYGVNALFLMSIIHTESKYGEVPAKGTKYNLAGLKRAKGGFQQPKSFEESIDNLASTLNRLYVKRGNNTPQKVHKGGYAASEDWSKKVVQEWENINKFIYSKNKDL